MRCLLAFFLAFSAVFALAQQDAKTLFQEGKALFKQEKWDEACSKFEIITSTNSGADEVWYAIGLCKLKLYDGNGARKALDRISSNRMDLKEKLARQLKATASERLSKIPIPSINTASTNSDSAKPEPEPEKLTDDPICQANRKVIAGAITMYSMDNTVKEKLPQNIFDLLKNQNLLSKAPECPQEGTFSIYQKDANIRVVCSVHGSDDESGTQLYKSQIAMPEEVKIAQKPGIKPAVDTRKGSLRELPLADLEKQATAGSAQAQIELGLRYRGGRRGVKKDEQQARAWLEKAANQEDARGMTELGLFLWENERGLALSWLEKAADQDNKASYYLGNMHYLEYISDRSLEHEKEEALRWFKTGADRGHPPSVVRLFNLEFSSSLSSITPEDAEPIKQAAMAGYPAAMKKYGEISGVMAGMQSDDDLQAESLAWHRLYAKFETDGYEKEQAGKFLEMAEIGATDDVKAAGQNLAEELASQISEFKEE